MIPLARIRFVGLCTTLTSAALLAAPAGAQHELDSARLVPVTSPIKHAGAIDVATGRWNANSGKPKLAPTTVFSNTCTWALTNFYGAFSECEDNYDEGRVPSCGTGAVKSQQVLSLDIAYCTFNATPSGGMNMELAFWNKLNGNCIGNVPVPHSNISGGAVWNSLANFYLDTSGLNLPGSTANGVQSCWFVTLDVSGLGWTMLSDGDGRFDDVEAEDKFIWGMRINDASPGGSAQPNGILLAGDPNNAPPGTCSYTIPCATPPLGTGPCGTGLGSWDGSWINVDNVGFGSSALPPAPCSPGVAAYGYGTNCYWFGGYPTNVFTSYYLRIVAETGGPPTFCTSKPSSIAGCIPTLTGSGTVVSKTSGTYTVTAAPVPGGAGRPGLLIWTRNGLLATPASTVFGFLCLSQFQRAGNFPAVPGGTSGVCDGAYTWPFQTIVASFPNIQPGDSLHVQGWYSDLGFPPPGNANFTNGIGVIVVVPDESGGCP